MTISPIQKGTKGLQNSFDGSITINVLSTPPKSELDSVKDNWVFMRVAKWADKKI
jgi:hypothetical protein